MKRIGYVRTSKNKQHTDRQINELKKKCDKVFTEKGISGRYKKRPVFENLLAKLQSGDELIVLAYDRAFRSVIEGVASLDELNQRGVKLCSIEQPYDPTTPDGRLFFIMAVAFAEWEVNNLALRTTQGLKAAKKRGARLGRPKKGEVRVRKNKRH